MNITEAEWEALRGVIMDHLHHAPDRRVFGLQPDDLILQELVDRINHEKRKKAGWFA